MKPSNGKLAIVSATTAVALLSLAALVLPIGAASSQQPSMMDLPGHGQMDGMIQQRHQEVMQTHWQGTMQMAMGKPAMPGQDAFGAIQEIVRMLEADPGTDWSKIDLEALRQQLEADAAATPVEGGLEVTVTGQGRTLVAIQRMVPAHAEELDQMNGWSARNETLPDGISLTVTSSDPEEVARIRGLGFIGLLVSGSHH